MSAFLVWIFWLIALVVVGIALAYRRVDLKTSTIVLGFALVTYTIFNHSH